MNLLIVLLIVSTISAVAAGFFIKYYVKPVDVWNLPVKIPSIFATIDEDLQKLGCQDELSSGDFEQIFKYILQGIACYSTRGSARIVYPGVSGTRGQTVEGLEGFARTSVLLASWLKSGRPKDVKLFSGEIFNVENHLLKGLVNGTNPKSTEYWGDIFDLDQRIVEAADIAIAFWIIKDRAIAKLSKEEIERVLNWLAQTNNKRIYGGNWLLFPVIINSVLLNYQHTNTDTLLANNYKEFKSFHVAHGWFTDGKGGELDYYNVWQMQYMLFWANEIRPTLDQNFIVSVFNEFSEIYQYFIGPKGIPIYGRSCCYRLAAATPLVAAAIHYPDMWQARARQALNKTWSYFLKKGALKDGRVTQGYFEDDEDLLENYSGRASPLWSLRSLSLAFYSRESENIWKGVTEKLPVEKSSYDQNFLELGIRVTGDYQSGEITLYPNLKRDFPDREIGKVFKRMSKIRKLLQYFLKRPLRIENYDVKYRLRKYTSSAPFFTNQN